MLAITRRRAPQCQQTLFFMARDALESLRRSQRVSPMGGRWLAALLVLVDSGNAGFRHDLVSIRRLQRLVLDVSCNQAEAPKRATVPFRDPPHQPPDQRQETPRVEEILNLYTAYCVRTLVDQESKADARPSVRGHRKNDQFSYSQAIGCRYSTEIHLLQRKGGIFSKSCESERAISTSKFSSRDSRRRAGPDRAMTQHVTFPGTLLLMIV